VQWNWSASEQFEVIVTTNLLAIFSAMKPACSLADWARHLETSVQMRQSLNLHGSAPLCGTGKANPLPPPRRSHDVD
jgi:hypothetical protein